MFGAAGRTWREGDGGTVRAPPLPSLDTLLGVVSRSHPSGDEGERRAHALRASFRRQYTTLLENLVLGRFVRDVSDLDHESCVKYVVAPWLKEAEPWCEVYASVLGPYAVVLRDAPGGGPRVPLDAADLEPGAEPVGVLHSLRSAGFDVLPRQLVEAEVPAPRCGSGAGSTVRLFEVLFTRPGVLPWMCPRGSCGPIPASTSTDAPAHRLPPQAVVAPAPARPAPSKEELLAQLEQAYGETSDGWRFPKTSRRCDVHPYATVLRQLVRRFFVVDSSDLGDDHCLRYSVRPEPSEPETDFLVSLSMVGPYAMAFGGRAGGRYSVPLTRSDLASGDVEQAILGALDEGGFALLTRELLDVEVPIPVHGTEPGHPVYVYHALFCPESDRPWSWSGDGVVQDTV